MHSNKHKRLLNNSSQLCLFSLPSLSLSPRLAPSPPCNLPQALHLSGLSACFFIWLVATGGSALADYNSAASHFRFIRVPSLCAISRSLPHLSRPHSLPLAASIPTRSDSSSSHYPTDLLPPVPSHLPYLPLLIIVENLAHKPRDDTKEILWQWKHFR